MIITKLFLQIKGTYSRFIISQYSRIQYDEITAFSRDTSRRFSEIKNNGIILATNSNGMQWEIKTEQSHNPMTYTRSQPLASSNER